MLEEELGKGHLKGKNEMRKKRRTLIVLALLSLSLTILTACGGKEPSEANPTPESGLSVPETKPNLEAGATSAPAPETGWFAKINKLAVETIIEKSDENGSSVERGELEIVIENVHPGSFSQENANEIFLDCWFKGMPHVGGLDSRAGILLDADTLEVIAYKEFISDYSMLHYLQTSKGQTRILWLNTYFSQGYGGQSVEIWGVNDGKWVEFPTGIEEFIPDEKKGDIAVGVNGPVLEIEDSFCYVLGDRLAVTYEQDDMEMFFRGERVPSELVAILTWNPYKERFELEEHVEQPAVQQTQSDKNEVSSH